MGHSIVLTGGGTAGHVTPNLALLPALKEAGFDAADVVKTTCFIKDINDFAAFNEVYAEYFGKSAPARSCVEVARLPKDVLCEVELVAYKD